jgi:hypothetical protein
LAVQIQFSPDTTDNAIHDFYAVLRVTSNSCPNSTEIVPVFVAVLDADNPKTPLPTSFSLTAYPNPFNPTSTIAFSLPQTVQVNVSVFDVTGRIVATLANDMYSAGDYRIPFHGEALASGLYFVRIESEPFTATQKIMLLK